MEMTDQPDGSPQTETIGAAQVVEVRANPTVLSPLRRFTSKLVGIAVRPRDPVVMRRPEVDRPGRYFSGGPHGGEIGPPGPDPMPAGRVRAHHWAEARCLITGALSRPGRALAEHLVRAGVRVVLAGRSTERLVAVAQGLIDGGTDPRQIITLPADLTVEADRWRRDTPW
jgi:hypothetical protein